jgi:hypothetical protein
MSASRPIGGSRESRLLLPVLLLAALALGSLGGYAQAQTPAAPPGPEEMRQIIERMMANTHRNDAAIEEYERIEHWTERRSENDPRVRLDKTYRVVPTGTGTLKVILKDSGNRVAPEYYREELRQLAQVLEWALNPEEPKQKARVEKWKKRTADRFQAVEAFRDAYAVTWLGQETLEGRALSKIHFEPKPDYHGQSIGTDVLSNSRVTVWLNGEAQVLRLEAELVRDLAFGGGLLGKIYKGGCVTIDQFEVAPGLWMPRTTRYEIRGRKFLFPEEQWRAGEASHYRRVGPPREALRLVRNELAEMDHTL